MILHQGWETRLQGANVRAPTRLRFVMCFLPADLRAACRAERSSSASQHVAAVPAPGAILVAAHPARIRTLGPLVPPVVPLVGIEAAVGVIVAIIVVAAVAVSQRRRRDAPVDVAPTVGITALVTRLGQSCDP